MKVRTDFVTNSSSSSFLIAKKGKLSECQREAIVNYVEKKFLGKKLDITKENVEQVLEEHYLSESYVPAIYKALDEGKEIFGGIIDFECYSEYEIREIYEDLWKILEYTNPDVFTGIVTDLSY